MGPYEVIFYEKQDGTRPVEEFLDSIDGKLAAKIVSDMRILAASGPATREPHSKELEDGIFELRSKQHFQGAVFLLCWQKNRSHKWLYQENGKNPRI